VRLIRRTKVLELRNPHPGRQVLLHEVEESALEQHGVLVRRILGSVRITRSNRFDDLLVVSPQA
jgi:hypothetical protein